MSRSPEWRIAAWSRELARGRVDSDAGAFDFDGHVALVGDFTIGEPVSIEIVDGRVTKVDLVPVPRLSPTLTPEWTSAIDSLSRAFAARDTDLHVVELRDECLRVEIRSADTQTLTATFSGVRFVQLPLPRARFASASAELYTRSLEVRPAWLQSALSLRLVEYHEASDVLVSFEPMRPEQRRAFVIAGSLTLS
jgi:hypothetical protein